MSQTLAVKNEWELVEEAANALTHGVGLVLSLLGLIAMLYFAYPDTLKLAACGIFGGSLILLYTASTLYHAANNPRRKRAFQIFDHCAIYVLIAGTYTPITLIAMEEGWSLFLTVWTIALLGIVFKIFFTDKLRLLSTLLYLAMGWLVVFYVESLFNSLPAEGLALLISGGLAYTFGTIVYTFEKFILNHAIWHMFVLAGSVFHFCTIFFYVI